MKKKMYEQPSTKVVELKEKLLSDVASPAPHPGTPMGGRRDNSSWDNE